MDHEEAAADRETKRPRGVDTSTPNWQYRETMDRWLDLTPIKKSPGSDLSCSLGSSFSRTGSNMENTAQNSFGLSNNLRQLLIKPRTESEEEENRRLIVETINLTRAALLRGMFTNEVLVEDQLRIKLSENIFYKSSQNGGKESLESLVKGLNVLCIAKREDDFEALFRDLLFMRKKRGLSLWSMDQFLDLNQLYEEYLLYTGVVTFMKYPVVIKKKFNVADPGSSPDLKQRKRSLSPTMGTQLGSLNKHSTAVKHSQVLRRRVNQTFFVESPARNLVLTTQTPLPSGEKNKKRRVGKRRLNSETKQGLITSLFSPKVNPRQLWQENKQTTEGGMEEERIKSKR